MAASPRVRGRTILPPAVLLENALKKQCATEGITSEQRPALDAWLQAHPGWSTAVSAGVYAGYWMPLMGLVLAYRKKPRTRGAQLDE